MQYFFKSERLGFRQWDEKDTLPFFELCSDPRVMEFFPSTLSYQEASELVNRIKKGIEKEGYGFYAVDLISTGQFIGFIGVIHQTMETDFTPCYEIGWRLSPNIWNKGLATEGAKACIKYMFSNYHCKAIFSITPIQNIKSERVMQKIGMQYFGFFDHPKLSKDSELLQHTIYKVSL